MRCLWLGFVGVMAVAGIVRGDDNTSAADQKFAEAMKLREAGKEPDACVRFKESYALNPNAIGTILNIARCAEEEGKTGTAVRMFTEARDRAREQNLKPQTEAAEQHLGQLVDHVPHLALAFVEPLPPEAKIVVADRVVDAGSAGDIIVDPGDVRVVISAPGRVPYETTVKFEPKGDHEHKAISVPKLAYPTTIKNGRRTAGKVTAVAGAAIALGGVVIGIVARRDYNNATGPTHCTDLGSVRACDTEQLNAANRARDVGNIGTIVGLTGVAIGAAGVALWMLSPNRDEHAVAIVPTLSPTEAGLAAVGRF